MQQLQVASRGSQTAILHEPDSKHKTIQTVTWIKSELGLVQSATYFLHPYLRRGRGESLIATDRPSAKHSREQGVGTVKQGSDKIDGKSCSPRKPRLEEEESGVISQAAGLQSKVLVHRSTEALAKLQPKKPKTQLRSAGPSCHSTAARLPQH